MAITQTGSNTNFSTTGNAGTFSTTLTVPADAELAVFVCNNFNSGGDGNSIFGAGSVTLTKGGVDTAMSSVSAYTSAIAQWGLCMFYMPLPDTGSNKTLKWDWSGTNAPDRNNNASIFFFKGNDTTTPLRDSQGVSCTGSLPLTTPSITAVSGDLIVAYFAGFNGGAEGTVDGWTNAATLFQQPLVNACDGAVATASPSGNQTVAVTALTNISNSFGGIIAASFKPAAASGSPFTLDADSAAYTWAATASGLDVGMPSDSAAYVWAPSDATLQYGALVNYSLDAGSAAYIWNASDASLEYVRPGLGGGAGHGQARSRAGGFWRGGRFYPLLEDLSPPAAPEPIARKPRKAGVVKASIPPAGMADIGRTSPKLSIPPNLTAKKPSQPATRKKAPPILAEAATTATLEDRIAKAIETGMAKALGDRAEADKPSAEEAQQAEEERELKLLRQLGFLGSE